MRLNNERLVCSLVTAEDMVVVVVAAVAGVDVIHFKLQKMLSIFILLKPFAHSIIIHLLNIGLLKS
jgi:hypothetical protein